MCSFLSNQLFSQEVLVKIVTDSIINNKKIGGIVNDEYYKNASVHIKENTQGLFPFQIKDSNFPLPYALSFPRGEGFAMTLPFLVDQNNSSFKLKYLDSGFVLLEPQTIQNDNAKDAIKFYEFLNRELKTLESYYYQNKELDQLLLEYSKKNKNSYILFWTLVRQFELKSYNEVYESIFNNLSNKIKNSIYGKIFYNNLRESKKIIIGKIFPEMVLSDKKIINPSFYGKQFTLIDFWFSHCSPCIADLPSYKAIYAKYKNKGLEIVGISTDATQAKDNWQKVIRNKQLDWQNFLDENGVESTKYDINKFPTTFLLDSDGIIIKKDLSPEELELFLEENLK